MRFKAMYRKNMERDRDREVHKEHEDVKKFQKIN